MNSVRAPRRLRPRIEGLEGRALLAGDLPALALTSATTADSRGVTFEYDVTGGDIGQAVDFGIYRSADDRFDAADVPIGAGSLGPAGLDDQGRPETAVGHHRLTAAVAGGLTPNPEHPFVLVVADPAHSQSGATVSDDTASFRKYTIGVVTHGGVQPKSWKMGVPWQTRMAESLQAEGYDAVIPYLWAGESRSAGSAARQGPRLARRVSGAIAQAPAGEPVDLHFIGHSEGTVVNSLAMRLLAKAEPAALHAGYVKATLLDPHAANNDAPGGRQYSVDDSALGNLARWMIDDFQSRADDPLPLIPSIVDGAEVFYQHTPIDGAKGSNDGLYNLWGQVPVPVEGDVPVRYYNLTGVGISHGGDVGVMDWYQQHVVPTLGDGSPFVDPSLLTGGLAGGATTSPSHTPIFEGASAPDADVSLLAIRRGSSDKIVLGRTTADASGHWTLASRSLPDGTYHIFARGNAGADPKWPRVRVTPKASLGTITVDTQSP
jgi:hypothetical protein